MAGNQTHGYDLVIEFAERAYQDLLSVIFDTGDFLFGTILGGLGINIDPAGGFSVSVSFDRPAGIPATATDVVDIRVMLGANGNLGNLRIVSTVDVDQSSAGVDLVRINLKDKLWITELSVIGFPIPGLDGLLRTFLRNDVRVIPMLPVPVDRVTTSTTVMKAADVRIIDDTSAADKDASACLISFGGGTPGDRNAFSQSFISPGGAGGIAVGFGWMCRVISPMIDAALNLGGAFADCRLSRTVRIDDDEDVDLTALTITPEDGFLAVEAKVRKSGFCYSATGTVGARIKIEVSNGNLVVVPEVDDPSIDVDIPWYCWVAGAVIGAVLGGIIYSVIGAIIGAVLIPLITYIAQEIIEGVVNSVAEHVAEALNSIAPSVEIPAVGFNLIFSDAFIDDVQIGCRVEPIDTAAIRATGTVVVPNGRAFDLDSGRVGARDMPSGDLAVIGTVFSRSVQTVCGARWARTSLRNFDELFRSAVYGHAYGAPNPVPLDELARLDPFGMITGNPFRESRRIYGVRTNEGRWAAVQATEVEYDFIRFRYITWEKPQASVRIVGEFRCTGGKFDHFGTVVKPGVATFVPSAAIVPAPRGPVLGTTEPSAPEPDPCTAMRKAVQAMVPAATDPTHDSVHDAISALRIDQRRIGVFVESVNGVRNPVGRFDAQTDGFGPGRKAIWQLNGTGLANVTGEVAIGAAQVKYELVGTSVILTVKAQGEVEMLLDVTVTDDAAHVASVQRCVHYDPRCPRRPRVTPRWMEYRDAWLTNFGVAEVLADSKPVVFL